MQYIWIIEINSKLRLKLKLFHVIITSWSLFWTLRKMTMLPEVLLETDLQNDPLYMWGCGWNLISDEFEGWNFIRDCPAKGTITEVNLTSLHLPPTMEFEGQKWLLSIAHFIFDEILFKNFLLRRREEKMPKWLSWNGQFNYNICGTTS